MAAHLRFAWLGILVASVSVADPWPGYQGNAAHTGYVPEALDTSDFALKWQLMVGTSGKALNPVAAGDGLVFASEIGYFNNAGLYAYDARTGEALWNTTYGSVNSVNPPAYANGRVYIQTGRGTDSVPPYFRGYDAATGQLAFESVTEAQWDSYYAPTIIDGTAYMNGGDYGGMYAFDAVTGARKWFRSLAQYDEWTPAVDASYAYAYVGGSAALHALNRVTGQPAFGIPDTGYSWNGYSMNLAPVLGGVNDAFVINGGRLIRFDLATRAISWQRSPGFTGQPTVAQGEIYTLKDGALSVWDQVAGTLLWSWSPPAGQTLSSPLIVTDSHVLVSGSSKVYAVDLATRTSDWNYPAAGTLALADHALYVAGSNGVLTAIRTAPPGAYDDAVTAYLSTPLDIDVLRNDDGFADPVTVSVSSGPSSGTAVVSGSPGDPAAVRVTYTPVAGFEGVDTFQYTAADGLLTDTATVTVTVAAPAVNADAADTHLNTPVAIDVLDNDSGFGGPPVTVIVTTDPVHGTAVVTGSPGAAGAVRIVYTPAGGFSGTDSLTYQVTNGINTGSAEVAITTHPYTVVDDDFYALNSSDSYLYAGANDIGFQDPVTMSIVDGPDIGSAHVDNSPGSAGYVLLHYFPSAGSYTTTITYEMSDGVRTDTGTATIHVVPFIARDDEGTTGMERPVVIPVAQNDLGFTYPRTVGMYTNPQHGTVVVTNPPYCCDSASVTYTPAPGFLGDDTFQYAIDDGTRIAIANVKVHVIVDVDADLIEDGIDNCLGTANASQRDTDGDLYGNMCDADLDNSNFVNFADLAAFRRKFGTSDEHADLDGNGVVNFTDLARFRALFGKAPGPSALAP